MDLRGRVGARKEVEGKEERGQSLMGGKKEGKEEGTDGPSWLWGRETAIWL